MEHSYLSEFKLSYPRCLHPRHPRTIFNFAKLNGIELVSEKTAKIKFRKVSACASW